MIIIISSTGIGVLCSTLLGAHDTTLDPAVVRHKYFSSTTLKELFSNVDARCIIDFTKESGFYHAI